MKFQALLLFPWALLAAPSFAAENGDQAIFDALNVPPLALPTPYPYAGWQKHVGRLTCSHMVNTQTREETYRCSLQ